MIILWFYAVSRCRYYILHPWVPAYQGVITLFVIANFTLATFMDPGVIPRGNCVSYFEKISELFAFLGIIHVPSSVLTKKVVVINFTDYFLLCVCVKYIVITTCYQNLKYVASDGKYKNEE
jgi:hypothetical protein